MHGISQKEMGGLVAGSHRGHFHNRKELDGRNALQAILVYGTEAVLPRSLRVQHFELSRIKEG